MPKPTAEQKFIEFLSTLTFKAWRAEAIPRQIPGVDEILKDLGGASKLGNIRFGIETKRGGKYWAKGQAFYGTARNYLEARYKAQRVFVELCWYRKWQSDQPKKRSKELT